MSESSVTSPTQNRIHRSLIVFVVLAVTLSWYPWFLVLLGYHGNGGSNPLGLLVAALIAAAVDMGWRGPGMIFLGIVWVRASLPLWVAAAVVPIALLMISVDIGLQ